LIKNDATATYRDNKNTWTNVPRWTVIHRLELLTKYSNKYIINIFNTNEKRPKVIYLSGIVSTFNITLITLFTIQNKTANIKKVIATEYCADSTQNQEGKYLFNKNKTKPCNNIFNIRSFSVFKAKKLLINSKLLYTYLSTHFKSNLSTTSTLPFSLTFSHQANHQNHRLFNHLNNYELRF